MIVGCRSGTIFLDQISARRTIGRSGHSGDGVPIGNRKAATDLDVLRRSLSWGDGHRQGEQKRYKRKRDRGKSHRHYLLLTDGYVFGNCIIALKGLGCASFFRWFSFGIAANLNILIVYGVVHLIEVV